jgi:hypothetical protein
MAGKPRGKLRGYTSGMTSELALLVIAACQVLGLIGLGVALGQLLPRLAGLGQQLKQQGDSLQSELRTTAQAARSALVQLELLMAELRNSGLAQRAVAALDSANAAAGRIDPLATQVASTLGGARELLDDATQTSQSVRGLAEDLAATNKELAALSASLADIATGLRDQDVAAKLGNVLADTSVLAADIGILAENANTYLETGKPLVAGLKALSGARKSAAQLGASAAGLRSGIKPGGPRR